MSKQKAKRPPFGRKGRAAATKMPLGILVVPLILLTALGIGTIKGLELFAQSGFPQAFGLRLGMALLSSVVISVLAFPFAYALAFKVSAGLRRWAVFVLIIPFVTSYLVRAYAWQALPGGDAIANGLTGILLGHLSLTLPPVVALQLFALAKIDRSLIEAAQNLGCGQRGVLFQVILPMAKGWIIAGALACFILAFGDFIAPQYLGDSGALWPDGPNKG